jgi:hypothetical protein
MKYPWKVHGTLLFGSKSVNKEPTYKLTEKIFRSFGIQLIGHVVFDEDKPFHRRPVLSNLQLQVQV